MFQKKPQFGYTFGICCKYDYHCYDTRLLESFVLRSWLDLKDTEMCVMGKPLRKSQIQGGKIIGGQICRHVLLFHFLQGANLVGETSNLAPITDCV